MRLHALLGTRREPHAYSMCLRFVRARTQLPYLRRGELTRAVKGLDGAGIHVEGGDAHQLDLFPEDPPADRRWLRAFGRAALDPVVVPNALLRDLSRSRGHVEQASMLLVLVSISRYERGSLGLRGFVSPARIARFLEPSATPRRHRSLTAQVRRVLLRFAERGWLRVLDRDAGRWLVELERRPVRPKQAPLAGQKRSPPRASPRRCCAAPAPSAGNCTQPPIGDHLDNNRPRTIAGVVFPRDRPPDPSRRSIGTPPESASSDARAAPGRRRAQWPGTLDVDRLLVEPEYRALWGRFLVGLRGTPWAYAAEQELLAHAIGARRLRRRNPAGIVIAAMRDRDRQWTIADADERQARMHLTRESEQSVSAPESVVDVLTAALDVKALRAKAAGCYLRMADTPAQMLQGRHCDAEP